MNIIREEGFTFRAQGDTLILGTQQLGGYPEAGDTISRQD